MDGNISKALWLGVSLLLFAAVVTIGLMIFGNMKNATDSANDKIGSIAQSVAEEEFRPFDGKQVKGDQVLSAIRNFSGRSGEVIVLVATLGANSGTPVGLNPTGTGTGLTISSYTQYVSTTSGTLSAKDNCVIITASGELFQSISKTLQDANLRDAENSNLPSRYINPSGKFQAYLIYDANQVIRGIICAQIE
jgi:hypothetical protein